MKLHVIAPDGQKSTLEAVEGFRVMEIIRDWSSESGIGIVAECGGACACATCHVYVDEAWQDRLPPLSEEEEDRLDEAFDVSDSSRLSCQLIMSPELDGLTVELAQHAFVPVRREVAA